MHGIAATLPAGISEEQFRRRLRDVAKLYGWKAYHTHRSDRSDPGWPDEVFCKGSRLLFVELKSATGRLSPDQRAWLEALAAAGQEVALWWPDDFPTALAVLGPQGQRAELVLPPPGSATRTKVRRKT